MHNYIALSREAHATKYWRPATDYLYAAREAVVPIVADELPKACVSMPLAFMSQAEHFIPVAILGFAEKQNLFVAPDGRWLGKYIPAALRGYPFRLANTPEGQQVLCVDIDSSLLTDGPQGQPIFDEDGKPAAGVGKIMDFLTAIEANRVLAASACDILQAHQLIVPWVINIQSDTGQQKIEGLYKIDEGALNALSSEDFAGLRQNGALIVCYCQMLSMQHLQVLGRLTEAHAQVAAQAMAATNIAASGELDLEFMNKGGTISFGNLG